MYDQARHVTGVGAADEEIAQVLRLALVCDQPWQS
jgi:hypothetical protein